MNFIPLEHTSIRPDGRKRVPWLGRRIGKLLRKRSSSNRVKYRTSFFRRLKNSKGLESPNSSGTPSPKHPSSPRRSESMKDRLQRPFKKSLSQKRKQQQPVSPLARSTSPIALSSVITPVSSPSGSTQNLVQHPTPPNSPPIISRPERHSMFVESNLLSTRKSISTGELSHLSTKHTSPHTSPLLLKRAVSPSPEQHMKVSHHRTRRSSTLERSSNIKIKKSPSGPGSTNRSYL